MTLFHAAVVTASEAGGQDLSEPASYGPYIINAVDTEISRVACDVVFPGGLIGVDDDGDEYSVGVELNIFVEPVDDAGDVSGGSLPVFDDKIVDHTRTAIRRTLARDVPPGRYQMTIERITGEAGSSEVRTCQLGAVKGYLVDDNEYGDVTLLAMRVRATANLSDSASRLVNVLNERLIPVWDPDSGWSAPVITRNPAWAFADAARSRYGGDFADDQIDLNGLHYLAGLFDSRGDCFDGRFDTDQSLWDALGKIGQVCRCGPVRHGNLIRMIRDQQIDTPVQQFSMANMSEFSIDYVMHNARTADSVKITFWDEDRDYAETTILCQLPDDTADIPQDVTLFGCTQYEQAWREGMYLAASNRERRQMVSWKTEMEGHIPGFGDLVIINHDLLGAGQLFSGTVSGVDGAVLTLSRDVEMTGESWYIILRDRLGGPSSPLPCEATGSHQVRVLDTLPAVETDPAREPTHFMIGQGEAVSWPVKITSITPESDDRVTVGGCIESEFVHTADQGEVPPAPPAIVPPPAGLDIDDLIATQGGTVSQPVVYLSWAFASGAERYLIEYSGDGRETWQPAGTGQSLVNNHEFTVETGLITCRVAAVSAVRGDWALIDVNAGGDFAIPGEVQPRLAESFTGNTLQVVWDKEPAAARYFVEVLYSGERARAVYLDRATTSYDYDYTDAQRDGAGRTLTVNVLAQNAEGVNGPSGAVTATNPPPAVPDQIVIDEFIDAFAVRVSPSGETDIRELRVWGSQTLGFTPDAGNLQGASTTTRVDINQQGIWYFRVAWVDNWGSTELNYSGEIRAESAAVDLEPIEKEISDLDDKINREVSEINLDLSETQQAVDELDTKTDQNLQGVREDLLAEIDTSVTTEKTERVSADEALAQSISSVSADLSDEVTDRKAAVQQEATARATEDTALGSRIDTVAADLSTETVNRTAAVQQESTARASADETLARQMTTVSSELDDEVADRKAAIQTESAARTSADESLASQISQVQSNYQTADSQLDAAIRNEATARADADEALSSQITTVIADYEQGDITNSAAIQQESTTRASADGALGTRIDTVKAEAEDNAAAIQTESTARASADGVLGQRIDTVQAVANDNTASVSQHSTAIAGLEDGVETLEASWGVTLDVNGYCSGFAMNNDGDHAEALFRADTFAVGSPGTESLTFVVQDGAVMMPGVRIQDGTIDAEKLSINDLSAISANMGTVTAGTMKTDAELLERVEITSTGGIPFFIGKGSISMANAILGYDAVNDELVFRGMLEVKSADTGGRLEIQHDYIRVYDENDTLRVEIGALLESS